MSGAPRRSQGGAGGVLEGHTGPLPAVGAGRVRRVREVRGPEKKFLVGEEERAVGIKVLHW